MAIFPLLKGEFDFLIQLTAIWLMPTVALDRARHVSQYVCCSSV